MADGVLDMTNVAKQALEYLLRTMFNELHIFLRRRQLNSLEEKELEHGAEGTKCSVEE